MALAQGAVKKAGDGHFVAALRHRGKPYRVGGLRSERQAEVVCDLMAAKHAFDTQHGLAGLSLRTATVPEGWRRLELSELAREALGSATFSQLVQQLRGAVDAIEAGIHESQGWSVEGHAGELMERAAALGHACLVQLLLVVHPGTATHTRFGEPPLLAAAGGGRAPVVRLLLEAAPQTSSFRDHMGYTALNLASSAEVVEQLLRAAPECAQAATRQGYTPLHHLAQRGDELALRLVLRQYPGAARLRNDQGHVPLHEACWAGRPAAVRLLLEEAPEMAEARDEDGLTPMHTLALSEGDVPGILEAARLLLAAAPHSATALTAKSQSPLDLAQSDGGRPEVAAALEPLLAGTPAAQR